MQAIIRTTAGTVFPLAIVSTDTINQLRQNISKNVGLSLDQFYLAYDQETLDDSNTIFDYGIQDHATLFCVQRPASARTLEVRVEGGDSLTLGFRLTDTVQKLKRIVAERAFGRRCPLVMMYNGKALEDLKTLSEYGVGLEAIVTVKRAL